MHERSQMKDHVRKIIYDQTNERECWLNFSIDLARQMASKIDRQTDSPPRWILPPQGRKSLRARLRDFPAQKIDQATCTRRRHPTD